MMVLIMSTKIKTSASTSTIADIRMIVHDIADGYGVKNIRVFGSFAHGNQRKSSDIDLLIDLPKDASLLDLVGLKLDLEDALHRKVDVVTPAYIKPALRCRILAESRSL